MWGSKRNAENAQRCGEEGTLLKSTACRRRSSSGTRLLEGFDDLGGPSLADEDEHWESVKMLGIGMGGRTRGIV